MTLNQLASKIAKREGKKSQVHIGNIREILGILADLFAEVTDDALNGPSDPYTVLQELGAKRSQKNAKTKD